MAHVVCYVGVGVVHVWSVELQAPTVFCHRRPGPAHVIVDGAK